MAALFNSLESSAFVAESKAKEESKELEKVEVGLRFRIDQIDAIDTGIFNMNISIQTLSDLNRNNARSIHITHGTTTQTTKNNSKSSI